MLYRPPQHRRMPDKTAAQMLW